MPRFPHPHDSWQGSYPLSLLIFTLLLFLPWSIQAQTHWWDTNGSDEENVAAPSGTWGTGNLFWNSDPDGGAAGSIIDTTDGADDLIFADTGSGTSSYTVTVDGTQLANGITIQSTGTTNINAAASTGGTISLGTGGITGASGHGVINIGAGVSLGGANSFINNGTTSLNFSGGTSGTGNLTIQANTNAAITLNGVNLTGGSTTLDSTTVTVASTSSLVVGEPVFGTGIPAGATVTSVTDGTTFELSLAATSTQTGQTYVTNQNNHAGIITNSGTGNGAVTIGGRIGSSVTGVTQNSTTSSLTITGSNAYTGNTSILQGGLTINSTNALGTSTVLLGDTSGSSNAIFTVDGTVTFANNFVVQSGNTGLARIRSTGSSTNSVINGSTIYLGSEDSAGHDLSLSSTNFGTMRVNNSIRDADGMLAGTQGDLILESASNGTVGLFGANTYSGDTIVRTGRLSINNGSALGTGRLIIDGGNLFQFFGSGNLTSNNAQIWNTNFSYNSGSSGINLDLGTGSVDLGNTGTDVTRVVTVSQAALTVGGVISNGSNGFTTSLTKSGGGTLVLESASNYTGATTVTGGVLRTTSGSNRLPTGTDLIMDGGRLELNGVSQSVNSLSGASTSALITNISTTGGNTQTLTVTGGDGQDAFNGNLTNSVGTLGLAKTGSGTVILNGENSHTGANAISGGTVIANSDGRVASSQTELNWGNNVSTITVSDASGLVLGQRLSGTGIASGTYIIGINTGTNVITLSRNTSGAGTSATLNFAATSALGTGATTVSGTGVLGGTGTFLNATTIGAGGTLSPGESPGLMTFANNLTFDADSSFDFELALDSTDGRGINFDGVDLTGSALLNIAADVTANLVFNGEDSTVDFSNAFWDSDHSWLVFSNANAPTLALPEIFATLNASLDSVGNNFSITGGTLAFEQDGDDVYLTYTIPEAQTGLLAVLAAGFAGLRFRRRRNV